MKAITHLISATEILNPQWNDRKLADVMKVLPHDELNSSNGLANVLATYISSTSFLDQKRFDYTKRLCDLLTKTHSSELKNENHDSKVCKYGLHDTEKNPFDKREIINNSNCQKVRQNIACSSGKSSASLTIGPENRDGTSKVCKNDLCHTGEISVDKRKIVDNEYQEVLGQNICSISVESCGKHIYELQHKDHGSKVCRNYVHDTEETSVDRRYIIDNKCQGVRRNLISSSDRSSTPLVLSINNTFGRHLVASRNISPGEVLLIELPLVNGPLIKQSRKHSNVPCISCYDEVCNDSFCKKCGFFLCNSEECLDNHNSSQECQYLRKLCLMEKGGEDVVKFKEKNFPRKDVFNVDMEDQMHLIKTTFDSLANSNAQRVLKHYQTYLVLKILLLFQESRSAYHLFTTLQSNVVCQQSRYEVNQKNIVNPIKQMFPNMNGSFIHKIASNLDVNAFEVKTSSSFANQAIYAVASFMTHSCIPNCEHSFIYPNALLIRATEEITKGSTLTISYTDLLWPTYIRQDHLMKTKNFLCFCERCTDKTEFGTYFGYNLCSSCNTLGICPSFSETSELKDIECRNCSRTVAIEEFTKNNSQICRMLQNNPIKSIKHYEELLDKLEKFPHGLHSSHHIIFRLKLKVLRMLEKSHIREESPEFRKLRQISRELLEVCVWAPKFSSLKVWIKSRALHYRNEF